MDMTKHQTKMICMSTLSLHFFIKIDLHPYEYTEVYKKTKTLNTGVFIYSSGEELAQARKRRIRDLSFADKLLCNPRELALPVSRQIVGFANLCEHAALKERETFSLFDLGVVIFFFFGRDTEEEALRIHTQTPCNSP